MVGTTTTIVVRCIVIQNVWVTKEHLRGNAHTSIFRPGIKCSNGFLSSVWVTTGIWLGVMRRSWGLLVDGRSGDVVVGGALDDMMVVVSVELLKGKLWFCSLLGCRGDEGSPKKMEHNDFFSCVRGLSMLTDRLDQKTSSPGGVSESSQSHNNFAPNKTESVR